MEAMGKGMGAKGRQADAVGVVFGKNRPQSGNYQIEICGQSAKAGRSANLFC